MTVDRGKEMAGRVVLITGARRVGGELALMLADRGASVVLTYHSGRDAIGTTAAEVERRGGRALAVEADLSRAGPAERAVRAAVDAFGRLDALVNMASTYRPTPFAELAPTDFDEMLGTNLAAPYFCSVAAGRAMLAQPADADGLKGRIVTVGDWATDRPYPGFLPYLVAKGALPTLTRALARELAPHVLVNLVQPGTICPPPGADAGALAALSPLHRVGAPADVNNLILYLLSGTTFATGTTFRVDGGRFLGNEPPPGAG